MDKVEARLLLQACRPDRGDASHPLFAEALALAERDPELKAWWDLQQEFDRKVVAKLREVAPPTDLRATILAGRKIEQMTPRHALPAWLAMAAAIVVLGVLAIFLLPMHSSPAHLAMDTAEYKSSLIHFLSNDPELALASPDHAKVMAWLREQKAPLGHLTEKMDAVPTFGCQKLEIHGHAVSLICFNVSDNEVVHLFVIDKHDLFNPPRETPTLDSRGAWSMASWSDENRSYVLVTTSPANTLRKLL